MSTAEFATLLASDDLVGLGMEADAERRRLHPEGIVTYCFEDGEAVRFVYTGGVPDGQTLRALTRAQAVVPICTPGLTGAEYLTFLAACRLCLPVPHIQIDAAWLGLKVAQVALRFGADDFGNINVSSGNTKPSSGSAEEEIRRLIREAGLIPKRRDPLYRWLALY